MSLCYTCMKHGVSITIMPAATLYQLITDVLISYLVLDLAACDFPPQLQDKLLPVTHTSALSGGS
jgi:hypothetical protein